MDDVLKRRARGSSDTFPPPYPLRVATSLREQGATVGNTRIVLIK